MVSGHLLFWHFWKCTDGSYALTALELYSDNKGRRIHLLTTGESGVLKIQKPVAHLQLTSPSGQRTKLSLKHALKTVQKQVFVATFYSLVLPSGMVFRSLCDMLKLCLPSSHSSRLTFSLSLTPDSSNCLQPASSKMCVCMCIGGVGGGRVGDVFVYINIMCFNVSCLTWVWNGHI